MRTFLQTRIIEIENPDLMEVIDDFCEMLNWRKNDYSDYNLREFLEVVFKADPKSISLSQIALPRVLDRKIGKLHDHGFYPVCRALKHDDTIEPYAGVTLLAFLKPHFAPLQTHAKAHCAPAGHDSVTRTILQRRRNGDL
jgi:hypothetical protein